jgi:mannose-6-phosphate isomerase-like protein (cupin superfamily)
LEIEESAMKLTQGLAFGLAVTMAMTTHYAGAQAPAATVPAMALPPFSATTNSAEGFSPEKLRALGDEALAKAKASANGSVTTPVETYPGHYITISARTKNGGGEFHTHYNDIFIVLDGEGTELTGGTIPDIKFDAAGEGRGAAVVGGTPHKLAKGDILHISAATPHQAIIEPGKSLVMMVIKVHQD